MIFSVASNRRRTSEDGFDDNLRRQAFYYGLPAVLLAIFGLLAMYFASSDSRQLERRYLRLAEEASQERKDQEAELKRLRQSRRIVEGSVSANTEEQSSRDEAKLAEIFASFKAERLYWEKLISLQPEDNKYLFNIAQSCIAESVFRKEFSLGNEESLRISEGLANRGRSLMGALADPGQTGYPPAHLWWAQSLEQAVLSGQIPMEQAKNLAGLALTHADHYLSREVQAKEGLVIKSRMAALLERWQDAKDAVQILFQGDPNYFRDLAALNLRLNRASDNAEVFRLAKSRLLPTLRNELPIEVWQNTWSNLYIAMTAINDYPELIRNLTEESAKIASKGNPDDFGKIAFLNEILSATYFGQFRQLNPNIERVRRGDLELLKRAYDSFPRNPDLLNMLTDLGFSDDPQTAAAAKAIYDPANVADPPPSVLIALGNQAVRTQQFDSASELFEQTMRKGLRTPQLLNNLAYSYLKSSQPNPERALLLSNDAIRMASQTPEQQGMLTFLYDTQGAALKQLQRYSEAIVSFETALRDRPNNRSILQHLVDCYEAANLDPAIYRNRLTELDAGNK
jgi:hypothetical protein